MYRTVLIKRSRLGSEWASYLQRGDVVLLGGEFGVGKTHLTQGIALGLGSEDMVNSPSFVLMNEYRAGSTRGRMRIYHVDLYRIEDPTELAGIGLEEALDGDGVCVIEWPERAAGWFPNSHLFIQMSHLSETKRLLRFEPHGPRFIQIVEALQSTTFA